MGNFISYYMNSTYGRQELYDYIKLSDAQNQTAFETTLVIDEPKPLPIIPKFYELFIYIDHDSPELKDLYVNSVHKHNKIVDDYFIDLFCFNRHLVLHACVFCVFIHMYKYKYMHM